MSSSRKAYARRVNAAEWPSKRARAEQVILYSDKGLKGVHTPHDDAVLITLRIANFDVKRILVDGGSSADILFYEAYMKMGLGVDRLKKVDTPLYGFSGTAVQIEGAIELLATVGMRSCTSTVMINFMVVKIPSAYNAILGLCATRCATQMIRLANSHSHAKC